MRIIRKLGDIIQIGIPAFSLASTFYYKDKKGFIRLTILLIVNQIAIETIKTLTDIQRPNGKSRAFPSGHTAVAFLGAFFYSYRYRHLKSWQHQAIKITLFASACFVGFSRWHCNAHWPSDIVGGFCLGFLLSRFSGTFVFP